MKAEELIEKNKQILIEEIGTVINELNAIISGIINSNDETGKLTEKFIHAFSLNVGFLTAVFNEYYVLLTGKINDERKKEKRIGFRSIKEEEE